MDLTAINDAIRAWLLDSTDLADGKVINAYQDAPRPSPPYAVVYPPLAITRRGLFDEERITGDGEFTRAGRRVLSVQIQLFGAGSVSRAHDAVNGLETYAVRDALTAVGLVALSGTVVANQTGLLQTRHEERAQIEPQFSLTDESTETVGWIETVAGTATYDGTLAVPFEIE